MYVSSIQLLKDRYLKKTSIKNPQLTLVLSWLPIVHTKGKPTDIEVKQGLATLFG